MKKCLLVIDYQNDFITGSLGFPKAVLLAEKIAQLIQSYHHHHHDVIFTLDTHKDDYLSTKEGKNLPIQHCIEGTWGHHLHPLLQQVKQSSDMVYYKNTFGSLSLANDVKLKNYDEITFVGLVTNICVLANVILIQSALPNATLIVDKNLCASFDETLHEKTLDVLKGIHVQIKE